MGKGFFHRWRKKDEPEKREQLAPEADGADQSELNWEKAAAGDGEATGVPPLASEKEIGSSEENESSEETAYAEESLQEEGCSDVAEVQEKPQQDVFEEEIAKSDVSGPEAMEADNAEPADSGSTDTEPESAPVRKGFFARLKEGLGKTRNAIADKVDTVLSSFQTVDEELFEELEEALIMADIGVETSLYIIGELRKRAKEQAVKESASLKGLLKEIITEILKNQDNKVDISHQPTVIMVIGVNGVGKTTSIGKMAARYRNEGKKVVLAAADTFRAAAIDQLEIWAKRAGVDIVKHQEGSDPSAVVFDAIAAAKSRGADIVICDTAGRLHNKKNLMEELKKTARVIERETGRADNEVLLVLDGSTGQNALIQAREFASVAGITGVILTKLDGTAKGGVIIALSREQNIGVKFIGVGEGIDDLQEFDPQEFANALFPDDGE